SDEEGLRNLLGCEPADLAQGERNARLRRQSGMAAGKDETEAVVLNLVILVRRLVHARLEVERKVFLCVVKARAAAHSIYRFEARGRDEPGARVVRNAGLRPRVQSSGKG